MVLNGEEDKAFAILAEDGLVGVASNVGVADKAVASLVQEVVDDLRRLVLLAGRAVLDLDEGLGGGCELVRDRGGLGEVELVELGGGDL